MLGIDCLIRKFQDGDKEAFKEIISVYREKIMGLSLYFTSDSENAKDLSQEIVLAMYDALPRFSFRSKFDTYLYKIAFNIADKMRRKENKNQIPLDMISEEDKKNIVSYKDNPEKILEDRQIQENMKNLISMLPDFLQQTIYLRYAEEKSYREISDILNCPVGTVMSRLNYIKKKMQESINKKEVVL